MAGPYFVDDGGDGSDGLTWAKAETSINDLDTAVAFASGEIVYFGADSVCQATNSASLTITGPADGPPVQFISSTVGSGTAVSYATSTSPQIDTSEAATYDLTFDGSFALIGLSVKSGRHVLLDGDATEPLIAINARFSIGPTGYVRVVPNSGSKCELINCIVDLTQDATTTRSTQVVNLSGGGLLKINGLTFVNAGYRTGAVFYLQGGTALISGVDVSGFTNGTTCELVQLGTAGSTECELTNILTAATWTAFTTDRGSPGSTVYMTNVGPADAPSSLIYRSYFGDIVSSTAIYRTGGATVEGDATSWLITTTAQATELTPFYTPWIYGTVSSTGSKTFDLYCVNDTADFTDAECWLEVEYLSTADEAIWALATDQRATITATAAAQTDDTTSTWNGTGPAFSYKQRLSVTCTIGETGQYRARVAVGVASIAGSRYFYVDPKVTVT